MNEKVKNVINKIISIVVIVFLVFAVLVTIMAFSTLNNKDGVPAIGGVALLTVESDSMAPTFKKGDLILGKKVTDIKAAEKYNENDVITFFADLDGDGKTELNTHRIVSITGEGENVIYKTKGDNNMSEDSYNVYPRDIKCEWHGKKLPGMGSFITFLKSPTGFLVCIVLPLAIFFVYELVHFVIVVVKIKNEDKPTETQSQISALEEEEIKRRAIEEYLRKQEEEKKGDTAAGSENNS